MTDFLNAMYQPQEEVEKPLSDAMPDRGIMNMPAMSAAIRRMDQRISDLTKIVEEQKRRIKQHEQHIKQLTNSHRGLLGDLKNVQGDLDNKISMRD